MAPLLDLPRSCPRRSRTKDAVVIVNGSITKRKIQHMNRMENMRR